MCTDNYAMHNIIPDSLPNIKDIKTKDASDTEY